MTKALRHRATRGAALLALSWLAAQPAAAAIFDEALLDLQPAVPTSVSPEGAVLGESLSWPCGATSACAPEAVWSVWRQGVRQALPGADGLSPKPGRIGPKGVVVGAVQDAAGLGHAAAWRHEGGRYRLQRLDEGLQAIESVAVAVDERGRTVGWRRLATGERRPCLWTPAGHLRDLVRAGFPAGEPLDLSPTGWVLTATHRYRLDDPASAAAWPAWPGTGFVPLAGQWRIDRQGRVTGIALQNGRVQPLRQTLELPGWYDWETWPVTVAATPSPRLGGLAADGSAVLTLGGEAYLAAPYNPARTLPPVPLKTQRGMAPQNVSLPAVAGIDDARRPVVTLESGGIARMARLLPQAAMLPAAPYLWGSFGFGVPHRVPAADGGGSCGVGQAREVLTGLVVMRRNADGSAQPQPGAVVRGAVLTRAGGRSLHGVTDANGQVVFTVRDVECDSPLQAWVLSIGFEGLPVAWGLAGRRSTLPALAP